MTTTSIDNWLNSVHHKPGHKFITGLRGTGKSDSLRKLHQQLLDRGTATSRVLWIDTEEPWLRQYPTAELLLNEINSRIAPRGKTCIFIREAALLPDADALLGALVSNSKLEILATASSRRIFAHGLKKYLGSSKVHHLEVLPSEDATRYTAESAHALWNEIFISDILEPNVVLETGLLHRAVGWLSDHVGDPLSLRIISRAISPTERELSPHTIERYLSTLEDSHVMEKASVMDAESGAISKRNYKYFFTDPALRLAKFGPAPDNEARRAQLNSAWLELRRRTNRIFCTLRNPEIDFITVDKVGHQHRYRANDQGHAVEI